MARSRLSVLLVTILTLVATGWVAAVPGIAADLRLGEDVVPTSQSVSLRLDADTTGYTGTTTVELDVRQETDIFRFHAEGVTLDRIFLTGEDGPVEVTPSTGEKGTVTVTAARKLAKGSYRLDIAFHDTFNTDAVGLYRMEKDGRGYSFTQFEADDAREAFPCWDEPSFKIPYRMTLTVPEHHAGIFNTLPEHETVQDGWKTITFRQTQPLPSYLLAVATGPLETVEIPDLGFPARVVTVQGQSRFAAAAIETTEPVLRALEAYFGRPYPFDKLDLIAVPEYWFGAMENPGAITYSDGILLLDPAATTLSQKSRLVRVTAHELAHMWFGDLVTMKWWDDLWLNESFADWMGDKITHQVYPEFGWDLTALESTLEVMSDDARPSTIPIRRPVESTDNLFENVGLAYDKGKAVLAMFEQWIGPETFRKGVLAYLDAHAWGNATADDLWSEFDRASGKELSRGMAGFIEQPGVPLVTLTKVTGSKVSLTQGRYSAMGVEQSEQTWRIPVGLKFASRGEVSTRFVLLDAREKTFDLGTDVDWVMPNAGSYGYYRWNVPDAMLDAIASNSVETLTPRERVGFISNAGALMTAGRLSGDHYLRALHALAADPEPMVVSCLLDALDEVRNSLVPSDEDRAFAAYVRQTLGPALDRIGRTGKPGEHETCSLLRPRLVAWLGDDGQDDSVRAFAEEACRAYLADPGSVDPALAPVAVRIAALRGGRELWEEYRRRAETASNPNERTLFLGALGSFRDPQLREATLRYALEGPIRPNEIFTVIRGLTTREAGREAAYVWMTKNYGAITGRLPAEFTAFMPFMASGCSRDRLAAAEIFFAQEAHQGPGTTRQLAKVADQVEECVTLRDREGEAVARYLEGFIQRP